MPSAVSHEQCIVKHRLCRAGDPLWEIGVSGAGFSLLESLTKLGCNRRCILNLHYLDLPVPGTQIKLNQPTGQCPWGCRHCTHLARGPFWPLSLSLFVRPSLSVCLSLPLLCPAICLWFQTKPIQPYEVIFCKGGETIWELVNTSEWAAGREQILPVQPCLRNQNLICRDFPKTEHQTARHTALCKVNMQCHLPSAYAQPAHNTGHSTGKLPWAPQGKLSPLLVSLAWKHTTSHNGDLLHHADLTWHLLHWSVLSTKM